MRAKSDIWRHYEKLDKNNAKCRHCGKVIKSSGNTSNLRCHMQHKHLSMVSSAATISTAQRSSTSSIGPQDKKHKELEELEKQATPRKGRLNPKRTRAVTRQSNVLPARYMYTTEADGTVEVKKSIQVNLDPNVTLEECSTPQSLRVIVKEDASTNSPQSLAAFLIQDQNNSIDVNYKGIDDKNSISDAIAEFIVMDLQLPSIVEAYGFQRLVATLCSPCEIPGKLRLTDGILPKIYETVRDSVLNELSSAIGDVSISIEEWESNSSDLYVTFSVHYQQQGFEDQLQSKVLQTFQCSELYNSTHWGHMIDNLLTEWNLKESKVKTIIIATDYKPLLSALKSKGFSLIPCLMFTLQEVCVKCCFSLKVVANVIIKVRAFLGLVFRNNNVLSALRIQEHVLELEDGPLTLDYCKTWISTYTMLEQMSARRSIINSVIDNIEPTFEKDILNFSDDEWSVIEDVVNVLEPFKVITMTLSEEKAPLVSLIKPLIWQIVSVHLKVRDNDTELGKKLKLTLSTMVKEKYSETSVNTILTAATTLDPRFKQLPYAIEEAKKILNGHIKKLLIEIIEARGSIAAESEEHTPSKKGRSGMAILLGDLSSTSNAVSITKRAELEIALYQSEPTANLGHCPLTWWQKSTPRFPNLSHLASSYNCIPASALPPNRIPVESQISFDTKRAKLGPDVLDKLLFLNMNRPLNS